MDVTVVLDPKASLVGKDVTNVWRHFRRGQLPDNLPNARFEKKKDLESTAKSLLKHKIKLLTGLSGQDVEQELGFSTTDGAGISVEDLRKVARLMILQASDQLPQAPAPTVVTDESEADKADFVQEKKKKSRMSIAPPSTATPSTPTRRATRKSLAPEMLRGGGATPTTAPPPAKSERVDCRLKQEPAPKAVAKTPEEKAAELRDDELGLGPNPTPQMVARKRRSIASGLNSSTVSAVPSPRVSQRGASKSPQKLAQQPITKNSVKNGHEPILPEATTEEEMEVEEEEKVEEAPEPVAPVSTKKRKRNAEAMEVALAAAEAVNRTAVEVTAALSKIAETEEDDEDAPAAKSAKRGSPVKKKVVSPEARKSTVQAVVAPQDEKQASARKPRKSMLMSAVESLVKPLLGPEEIEVPDPKEQEEVEEGPVQPAAAKRLELGFPGDDGCRIYLGQSQLTTFKASTFTSKVKDYPGANMVVLHTPVSWDPTDVFSLVMAVRAMNRSCQMSNYTVLVGCGLSNVHLLREALYRQTKHVQFLVFDRKDADLEHPRGKLRDVNSYFLLAYFFEGCELDPRTHEVDVPAMVRPGSTTNFKTESVEDLENQIVHTFTEKGDWVLDLFCGDRELSLAAQKSGRNAIAVHNRADPLDSLKHKASSIASHFDSGFDRKQDGIILQF